MAATDDRPHPGPIEEGAVMTQAQLLASLKAAKATGFSLSFFGLLVEVLIYMVTNTPEARK